MVDHRTRFLFDSTQFDCRRIYFPDFQTRSSFYPIPFQHKTTVPSFSTARRDTNHPCATRHAVAKTASGNISSGLRRRSSRHLIKYGDRSTFSVKRELSCRLSRRRPEAEKFAHTRAKIILRNCRVRIIRARA